MPRKRNDGLIPPAARGKRVKCWLRNGTSFVAPADSTDRRSPPTRWTLQPENVPSRAFDIIEWDFA